MIRLHPTITALALAGAFANAAENLPRSHPEAEGISSRKLSEFVASLDRSGGGVHSVMVVRRGRVVAEGWWAPFAADRNHVLYSLSKSFTSTAIGFAVAEDKVDVFDPVLKFFPEDAPGDPGGNLKAIRVRDLLTMATGHQDEPPTAPDEISAKSFLAHPVPHKPGTHFRYNTAATFIQSAIVQKITGQTVLDYLGPRLFEPLGIAKPEWDSNFEGINLGGYGLRVRTEDIAKLGQLYLQKGKWKGVQLLPETWVEQATARQMSNGSNPDSDWDQGYGYQFWRCRHGAYRGDGAFGQYCVVMPEQDMVVAITSGVKNMPAVLNMVWDKLLPAVAEGALAPAPDAVAALEKQLAGLRMPTVQGEAGSALAGEAMNRTFVFPANDQGLEKLTLTSSGGGKTLQLVTRVGGGERCVPCAHGEWATGRAPFDGGRLAQFADEPIAASFAWTAADTCVIRQIAVETPFTVTLMLKFAGDQLTVDAEANVAFGPSKRPTLVGRAE